MPLTKRLYPYSLSNQLGLRPSDPHDPTNEDLDLRWVVREDASDEEVQRLDLSQSSTPWRELRLRLHATLPATELQRVLPDRSDLPNDAQLIVSINCNSTRLREPVSLVYQSGAWTGEITIRRDSVRDVVRLIPRLVRRTDLPAGGTDGSEARERGMIVAEGRSLDLTVDPPAASLQGTLRASWEDFSTSSHPWRREHHQDIYYLDLDERDPKVVLNSRHASLRAAMHTRTRIGAAAVIRHASNALIAQSIWIQLFAAAVAALEPNEETGAIDWPVVPWQRMVLATFAAHVFRGQGEEEQLRRLAGLRSGDQAGTLMTWIGSAAQEVVKSHLLIRSAVRAAEYSPQEGS